MEGFGVEVEGLRGAEGGVQEGECGDAGGTGEGCGLGLFFFLLVSDLFAEPLLSALLRRMPTLEALEILRLVNCPESFTPDMRCVMGESPTLSKYFVLAGMNSQGCSLGGGAGRCVPLVNSSPLFLYPLNTSVTSLGAKYEIPAASSDVGPLNPQVPCRMDGSRLPSR